MKSADDRNVSEERIRGGSEDARSIQMNLNIVIQRGKLSGKEKTWETGEEDVGRGRLKRGERTQEAR